MKYVLSLLLCLTVCTTTMITAWWPFDSFEINYNQMSMKQARKYVHETVSTSQRILGKYVAYHYFETLESSLLRVLKQAASEDYYHEFSITRDHLNQYIQGGILELIEQHCFDYAYARLKNSTKARAIAESMRNNALANITQKGFDPHKLLPFVGPQLAKAVNNYSYEKPDKVYPSDYCCVCTESFDDVTRVFLHPCGHDICRQCATQWFFSNSTHQKKCPLCRSHVDLQQLLNTLDLSTQ